MLQSLALRVALMVCEGSTLDDACAWVLRRFDRNLQPYYRRQILGEFA